MLRLPGALALIFVHHSLAGPPTTIDQQLFAPDPFMYHGFGHAIAASDSCCVIGAQADESAGPLTGAAYIGARDGLGLWTIEAKLTPSPAVQLGCFGEAVAIDGPHVIVGARQAGRAYIFRRTAPGAWVQEANLAAPGGFAFVMRFGGEVAIQGDEAFVASEVDEIEEMWLFVFRRNAQAEWQFVQAIQPDDTTTLGFGSSLAVNGDRLVVGNIHIDNGPGLELSGAAYVFERDRSGLWQQTARLAPADPQQLAFFGADVAIDGDVVLVGAPGADNYEGALYEFRLDNTGRWTQTARLVDPPGGYNEGFGGQFDVGGNRLAVSVSLDPWNLNSGLVRLHERDANGEWTLSETISSPAAEPHDLFGIALALAGGQILIGATVDSETVPDAGAAFVATLGPCKGLGDVDGDGAVTQSDLGQLLTNFGCAPPVACAVDLDGDGATSQSDLGILLAGYGQNCY